MRAFSVAFLVLTFAGCTSAPPQPFAPRLPGNDSTLSAVGKLSATLRHAEVIAAVDGARDVKIFEGLPNSNWDPSFKTEASRDDIVHFHTVPFYEPPLIPKKEDLKKITTFLKRSFPAESATFSPPKQCGDFHADFCVVFSGGTKRVGVMFCFTCADLVAFTDEAFWLIGIEETTGLQPLKEALFKYRSKRPPERLPNQALQPTAAAGRG